MLCIKRNFWAFRRTCYTLSIIIDLYYVSSEYLWYRCLSYASRYKWKYAHANEDRERNGRWLSLWYGNIMEYAWGCDSRYSDDSIRISGYDFYDQFFFIYRIGPVDSSESYARSTTFKSSCWESSFRYCSYFPWAIFRKIFSRIRSNLSSWWNEYGEKIRSRGYCLMWYTIGLSWWNSGLAGCYLFSPFSPCSRTLSFSW